MGRGSGRASRLNLVHRAPSRCPHVALRAWRSRPTVPFHPPSLSLLTRRLRVPGRPQRSRLEAPTVLTLSCASTRTRIRLSFSSAGIWIGWRLSRIPSARTTRSARPLLASPRPACTRLPCRGCWLYTHRGALPSCLGVLSTQAYTYFKRYPLDKPFYKLLVRDAKLAAYSWRVLIHDPRTYRSSDSGARRVAVVGFYGR